MIVGITGTLGAGKGTVAKFLKRRGFMHYSVREFLVEEIVKRGLEVNRESMVLVANDLRARFGGSYIVEELYNRAKEKGGNVVIESIRCVGEVESLKKKKDFVLWAVDADVENRYARIVERKSSSDKVSFQDFVRQEEKEMENVDKLKQNLKACIEMSDVVFRNDWTIVELESKVEKVLGKGFVGKGVVKRNAISWDDYFMAVAGLSAQRSKDPSTQVGACVVDSDNKIVGVGYNGFPTGCDDDKLPWDKQGDFLNVKYPYVCHAELNAILNSAGKNLKGASIYVYLFPCNECAKAIIQSGIKEVVYLSDKYASSDATKASRRMFEMVGISLRQLVPNKKNIEISLDLDSV